MLAEIKVDEHRKILIVRDQEEDCYRVYNKSDAWGSMLSSKHPRSGFGSDEDFVGHIQKHYKIIR